MLDFINKHPFITLIISILAIFLMFKIFVGLASGGSSSTSSSGSSYYSRDHKCEYAGCSNYASGTKYCSKHTTYSKCSYPGCNNSVSYSGAKYCSTYELTLYKNK